MEERVLVMADLVDLVLRRAPSDPLDRVGAAVELGEELTAGADELVGHFIDQARRDGRSWTVIGGRLGVSKQAARQRFGDLANPSSVGGLALMPRLKICLEAAEQEATGDGSPEIGTHHQLLGLFQEGVASAILEKVGLRADDVRGAAHDLFPPSDLGGQAPGVSFEARQALEQAARRAREAGCDDLGTEHLLSAIVFDPGSRARRVLLRLEADLAEVKKELACFVAAPKRRRRGPKWTPAEACSFCGKRRQDFVRLVAGPGVWICDECVRLCAEIMSEEEHEPRSSA